MRPHLGHHGFCDRARLVPGIPKKLGSAFVTRPYNRGSAAPRIAKDGAFGASLAAYDHRLATARVTLREPAPSNGFVNGHKMLHHRVMPSIVPGAGMSLNQLATKQQAEMYYI